MNRARVPLIVSLVLGLAACSAPGPSTSERASATDTPIGPGSTASASAPQESADAGAGAGGSVAEACELLSADEVEELVGWAVASVEPNPLDSIYDNACRWVREGGTSSVDLGIESPGGRGLFDQLAAYEMENGGEAIEDLGDEAVRSDLSGAVIVLQGDTLVDVFFIDPFRDDDPTEALMQRVLENLASN